MYFCPHIKKKTTTDIQVCDWFLSEPWEGLYLLFNSSILQNSYLLVCIVPHQQMQSSVC